MISETTQLFVLDRVTRNYIKVFKLFVFERNKWNYITVFKLLVLDRNTYHYTTGEMIYIRYKYF